MINYPNSLKTFCLKDTLTGVIPEVMSFRNEYDDHAIKSLLEQIERLLEERLKY